MKIGRHFTLTQFTASALIWVAVFYSGSVLALENSVATHRDHGKTAMCDCGMHSSEGECDHKQIGAVTGFGETDPASQMEGQGTIHGRDFTASKPEELVGFAETDTASQMTAEGALHRRHVTAWKPEELVGFAEAEPASDMMSQTTGIALVSVSSDDARQLSQHGQTNSTEVHRGNDRMTRCNC
jgi:hypothetical protein